MNRKKRSLSVDDQKAVDVILNSAAGRRISPLTEAASPERITAVSRLLYLLNELPPIEPPVGLMARTMDRIDDAAGRTVVRESLGAINAAARLH